MECDEPSTPSGCTPVRSHRRSVSVRKSLSNLGNRPNNLVPYVVLSPICPVPVNDDDAERRERQRERVRELQKNILSSPATPADKRQSLSSGIAGLTNAQLTEHYANCMKLSAENKITIKNAFGLHLIDYMGELMKKNDGSTNFQMASCTLDASAKIYAYRVDCVHADVYKMAGGLSLAEEPKKSAAAENDDAEMPDDAQKTARRKKKTRKSATVETNVKSLNINKLELGFQADALFLKMSKAFEEGGINGLLFNICAKNDSCELLLDASAPYRCNNEERDFPELPVPKDTMGPLYQIKSDEKYELCPSISNFSFINSDSFMNDEDNEDTRKKTNHTFDINSEPEPVECDVRDDDAFMDDNAAFGAGDDDTGMDVCTLEELSASSCNAVQINCAARRSESIAAVRLESVADLTSVLAQEPTEYSYFNHNLLTAWAGPNHWRLRTFAKAKSLPLSQAEAPRRKTKKIIAVVDFEIFAEAEKALSLFSKAVKLAKKTLQQWDPDKNTLPDDLFYDPKKLYSLSHIQLFVSNASKSQTEVSSHVGEYDYNNANDRENYCPDIPCAQNDDDEQLDTFGGFNQSFGSPVRASCMEAEAAAENMDAYTGSNLVEQPQKVEKVQISYAKVQKKIDVKKLKAAVWDILLHGNAENKENVDQNEPPTKMKGSMKFSEVYAKLPEKISPQMAKNLSVPVAFVCFLYIANEKSLHLDAQDNLEDFSIRQG